MDFVEFAQKASNIELAPWQKVIAEKLAKGELSFQENYRHSKNISIWNTLLESWAIAWKKGQTTAYHTLDVCSINRPKIIFDEFYYE